MSNNALVRRMGFNINPSVESRVEALRRLAQQRYELAGQYQAEVDRRKAKLDNSAGPEWAQGLTNQNLRDLTKVLRQQASDAGVEAVATPFGGKLPGNDRELQSAQQAQAGTPRLSDAELAKQAHDAWKEKYKVKDGDRYELVDGSRAYIAAQPGYSLSAKLPARPQQGETPEYLRAREMTLRVLGERKAGEGFLNDFSRWSKPVSRGASFGTDDHFAAAASGALAAGYGEGSFQDGYKHYLMRSRQERDRLNEEYPVWSTTGEIAGAAIPAIATGGASVPGQLAARTMMLGGLGEAVKIGGQAYLTTEGDWRQRTEAAARKAPIGLLAGVVGPALPKVWQNSILEATVSSGLDKSVDMATGIPVVAADPNEPFRRKNAVRRIVREDGRVEELPEEPEDFLFHSEENTAPTLRGSALENFTETYPVSRDQPQSLEQGAMQLPSATIPPMSVVDGKLFLGGDPRDPRNWTTAKSQEPAGYYTGGGF